MNTGAVKRRRNEEPEVEFTRVVTANVKSNVKKSPDRPFSNRIKKLASGKQNESTEKLNLNLNNTEKEVEICDVAVVDSLERQDSDVDVLKPTKTKVYQEFDTNIDFSLNKPDYKFEIQDICSLIQQETELMGKEFRLPGLDFPVQVKCDVKYNRFVLSMAFLDPKKDGKPFEARMNTKFIIILKRTNVSNTQFDKTIFARNFTFMDELRYGRFKSFLNLSYRNNIQNDEGLDANCITLHLFVKTCWFETDLFLENRILQWKITKENISSFLEDDSINGWKEFGLTPFFYSNSNGLRVQIRLGVRKKKCFCEASYLNETREKSVYPRLNFSVIHPTDTSLKLSSMFITYSDKTGYVPEKSLFEGELAAVDDLVPFICDNKILIRIEEKSS